MGQVIFIQFSRYKRSQNAEYAQRDEEGKLGALTFADNQ